MTYSYLLILTLEMEKIAIFLAHYIFFQEKNATEMHWKICAISRE